MKQPELLIVLLIVLRYGEFLPLVMSSDDRGIALDAGFDNFSPSCNHTAITGRESWSCMVERCRERDIVEERCIMKGDDIEKGEIKKYNDVNNGKIMKGDDKGKEEIKGDNVERGDKVERRGFVHKGIYGKEGRHLQVTTHTVSEKHSSEQVKRSEDMQQSLEIMPDASMNKTNADILRYLQQPDIHMQRFLPRFLSGLGRRGRTISNGKLHVITVASPRPNNDSEYIKVGNEEHTEDTTVPSSNVREVITENKGSTISSSTIEGENTEDLTKEEEDHSWASSTNFKKEVTNDLTDAEDRTVSDSNVKEDDENLNVFEEGDTEGVTVSSSNAQQESAEDSTVSMSITKDDDLTSNQPSPHNNLANSEEENNLNELRDGAAYGESDNEVRDYYKVDEIDYDSLECGMKNAEARILGGEETLPGEWPWQVVLVQSSSGRAFCGASLINSRFLLTAAHCATLLPSHQIEAWIGGHNLSLSTEQDRVIVKVSQVVTHHRYDRRTLAYDLALLRLARNVKNTRTVRPVCLPDSQDWDDDLARGDGGRVGVVAGWGLTEEQGRPSNVLLQVGLPFVSVEECRRLYRNINPVTDYNLCTMYDTPVPKDSCKGDSGGPLVVEGGDGQWRQVGVISFGYGCGRRGYPAVYTRLTRYLLWIYINIVQIEISLMPT